MKSLQTMMVVVVFASAVFAQSPPDGEVRGTITDQTGAVIVGAVVTLVNDAAPKRTAATDHRGAYVFTAVAPGRYTLTASSEGFRIVTARVDVAARSTLSRDIRLSVALAESVAVNTGAPEGLSNDPRQNLSALLLTADDLAALPEDPAGFLRAVLEMAGSTGQPDDIAVFVDGFREYKRLPPKSVIDFVRINSNPFSAEFPQPGPGRIEIATKPGSDSFHGDVRLQAADSMLDAGNPLAETKPATRDVNYNGYLQGPISAGKVDFTVYAGQWTQDLSSVIKGTAIDPATNLDQPFAFAVSTPTRLSSFMLGTNISVFHQRLNLSVTRNEEVRRNGGLEGFDLPERAFDRSSTDEIGRLWWTAMGRRTLNDVRIEVTRSTASTTTRSSAPSVLVLDAFNAGSNQDVVASSSTIGVQLSETLTVQQGRHTRKGGIQFESSTYESVDHAGFAGTFIFGADVERDAAGNPILNRLGQPTSIAPIENYRRTLLGRRGYAPSTFWIVRGTPDVGVRQWNVGWFFVDDWMLSNRLTVSYGIRQDIQNNLNMRANMINERMNLAPRAAVSWLLDSSGKNAIRAAAGIFSARVDPRLTLDTNKFNGVDRQQFIIERPSGFPSFPPSMNTATPVQSAVYIKADDLRTPYAAVAMVSYERQLPWQLFGVAQYTHAKGAHLLRLRNIAESGAPVLQFESTGRSLQRQIMLALRGNISARFTAYLNYTYGTKYSDTDGPYTAPAAADRDLAIEYGPAFDDQRHRLTAGTTMVWPGLSVSPSFSFATGRPFNITTGRDDNNDSLFIDRPAFAAENDRNAIETAYGRLNANPKPGDAIIPRNFGRERDIMAVNLSVSKSIAGLLIGTIDIENLLSNRRFIRSNGVVTSPTFGNPNQALNGRRVIVTLRYML